MHKDSFFYSLRDRLEFAKDFANGYSIHLKRNAFQKKFSREFYKDKYKLKGKAFTYVMCVLMIIPIVLFLIWIF